MRRVGLGRYPDVLLEKARKIATQHRGRIFDGADPAGEKQTEHAQDDNTVQALYELYRSRKEKVLRSWSEVRRILEKEVLPAWRHRRVADIRRRDVRELVEEQGTDGPDPGQPRAGTHLRAVHVCRRPGLDRSEPGVADQETGT